MYKIKKKKKEKKKNLVFTSGKLEPDRVNIECKSLVVSVSTSARSLSYSFGLGLESHLILTYLLT